MASDFSGAAATALHLAWASVSSCGCSHGPVTTCQRQQENATVRAPRPASERLLSLGTASAAAPRTCPRVGNSRHGRGPACQGCCGHRVLPGDDHLRHGRTPRQVSRISSVGAGARGWGCPLRPKSPPAAGALPLPLHAHTRRRPASPSPCDFVRTVLPPPAAQRRPLPHPHSAHEAGKLQTSQARSLRWRPRRGGPPSDHHVLPLCPRPSTVPRGWPRLQRHGCSVQAAAHAYLP